MNLIHIDDVSLMVQKLIEIKPRNEIYNIGGKDYTSESYFESIGKSCSKRVRYIPNSIIISIGSIIPSTLWLLKKNITINCDKVKSVTGIEEKHPIQNTFIFNDFDEYQCDSLDELKALQRSSIPFRAYGIGYFLQLNPGMPVQKKLLLERYNGIVSIVDNLVTVKSGTKLSDLSTFLENHGLALPTLPEFSGVTAGACFFVEVHGSSCEYFSLYDLITEIKYLDDNGSIVTSPRNDHEWNILRKCKSRFILLELTFECVNFSYLSNKIEWKSDEILESYLSCDHKSNMSTTIQWYPYYGKCLIYNINKLEGSPSRYTKAKPLYRGSPYKLQRLIVGVRTRGRNFQYDKCYNILGPWKDIPLRSKTKKYLHNNTGKNLYAVEFYSLIDDILAFVCVLKNYDSTDEPLFEPKHTIGFRFSYKRELEKENIGYIWVEILCEDLDFIHKIIDIAKTTCNGHINFHKGKYIPY
jgi:hypothetical protein